MNIRYGGSALTMAACSTNGVYTMHTKGANHTLNTSQFHTACCTSPGPSTSHPTASIAYKRHFTSRKMGERPSVEDVSGTPRASANEAAREKLSTEMMEVTADAKQRLRERRRSGSGASDVVPGEYSNMDARGMAEMRAKMRREYTS